MKRVLLVTDGWVHPSLRARWILHKRLADMTGVSFEHVRSLDVLPQDLAGYAALVLYLHHQRISRQALTALAWYVSQGGGILGLHSATASFRDEPRYHQILGGRFVGHGRVETFHVTPVDGTDLFSNVPAFTVKDELYDHELQPGIELHFTAEYQGRAIPVVWTHRFGRGRVCYASPGHRAATLQNETYQQILQRGLVWVCGA